MSDESQAIVGMFLSFCTVLAILIFMTSCDRREKLQNCIEKHPVADCAKAFLDEPNNPKPNERE